MVLYKILTYMTALSVVLRLDTHCDSNGRNKYLSVGSFQIRQAEAVGAHQKKQQGTSISHINLRTFLLTYPTILQRIVKE